MSEEWREIAGTDGWYEVSNEGRVRSWKLRGSKLGARAEQPRAMKLEITRQGYIAAPLRYPTGRRSRHPRVHQLVLAAFKGPAPAGFEARHLDGDQTNNRISNLAWSTHAANMADRHVHGTVPKGEEHWAARLSEGEVRELRSSYATGVPILRLATRFGITDQHARRIVQRLAWSHV